MFEHHWGSPVVFEEWFSAATQAPELPFQMDLLAVGVVLRCLCLSVVYGFVTPQRHVNLLELQTQHVIIVLEFSAVWL